MFYKLRILIISQVNLKKKLIYVKRRFITNNYSPEVSYNMFY